jgi:hypothetical protein|eukprot:CAMPEP_0174286482 /NCGR_PEP_ID=MMETSP0809-20121228/12044_1 /TAXON_ID=73025 ORGANISM="Eutreptiella gymnastica-like, Strain CCMP1594" /NCGR_SAMPLE_ID=MMETSP0809 /ASSEMBLY_ACC=CAM_ASM_000658 /LENGTH=189 /DNA_ID=CAMNT_0015382575 /DNA_START=42 /DNA_END=611 /DNA_ORIENTATION=+
MPISVDDVLQHTKPTEGFLVPLSANIYNIAFHSFKIRDMDSNEVLFEVDGDKEPEDGENQSQVATHPGSDVDPEVAMRTIRYNFRRSFLKCRTIGTKLVFSVGDKPVPNFRMIERHYFRDKLIKSFDFNFGFCIPNSTNSWEAIYDLPELTDAQEEEIRNNPYESKSDSFYFVDGQLVMHNKAEYAYTR